MGSYIGYQCSVCGKTYPADYKGYVCDSCSGNLNVILDYDHIKKNVKPEDIFTSAEKSLWRYLPLLPVEDPGLREPRCTPSVTHLFTNQKHWLKKWE